MMIWKQTAVATLVAALLTPLPGMAFGLGEISVHSYLGEPLRATIPLQTEPNEEVDVSCLSLAPPPEVEGMIYLRHARLSLSTQGDGLQLTISGSNVLNEPFISVVIQSNCQEQGRLKREYTLLIDPATYTAAPSIAEPPPAVADKHSAMPASSATGIVRPRPQASRTVAKPKKPVIVRKPAIAQNAALQKGQLKVASGAGEIPARPDQTEKERLQQRENELTKELDDKTAQFLAMQAQLTTLESKLAEMKNTIELQNKMMASMQAPSAAPQKPAQSWLDYWPAVPGILIAGLVYFLTSRWNKRSGQIQEPDLRTLLHTKQSRNPF